MAKDVLLLIVNTLFYISFAAFYLRRYGFNFKTFPLIIWAFSSIVCINYYTSPDRYHTFSDELSFFPFLYLFVLVFISFIPLLYFDNEKIVHIGINHDLFVLLCIVIILLSLLPLIKNITYFINNMSVESAFLDQYNAIKDGETIKIMSGYSAKLMRYCSYFRGIVPIFLVVSFSRFVKRNVYIRSGLALAWMNNVINSMNLSYRFAILTDFLYIVFLYLLFEKVNSFNSKNFTKSIIVSVSVLFVFIASIMTSQRFGEESGYSKEIGYSLSLYAGESFVNFNGDLWNIGNNTYGDNCLWLIKKNLEGKKLNSERNYKRLERIVHRRMNVYYTFIGDYYVDLGVYLTFVLVVLLSIVFFVYTKTHLITSLGTFILLALYSKVLLLGFTYWTYMNFTYEIFGSLAIALLFLNTKPTNYKNRIS